MRAVKLATITIAGLAIVGLAGCAPSADEGGEGEGGGTKTFTIASPAIGLSTVPILAAADALREQGYTIETPELSAVDVIAEGVASGQFAFGSGGNSAVLSAVGAGADLIVVVDRSGNETSFWGVSSIQDCADLAGKRVAINSAGSVSTYMIDQYIADNCPGTEPGAYIAIEGSEVRMAALLNDQVDAAPMDVNVTITLAEEGGGRFDAITNFAEDLPDLRTNSVFTSRAFAEENPETVKAFIKALLEEFRKIAADDGYLAELARKYAPDAVEPESLEEAARVFRELNLFPVDGGLTEENLDFTAHFFGPDVAGAVDRDIPADEWSDLSYLQDVLAQLD